MAPAHAPSPCSSVSHSRCALPRHWRASCWRDVAASVLLAAALLLLCTRAGAAADQHWCLVMADDRFGAAEVAIAASRTEAEAMDAWQASSPDDLLRAASPWTAAQTGQWTRTNVMLNKLYALATNAGFILVTHETNDRAVAWSKVKLMRELLPMHPECEWLMWLDSDSYVWMDRCLSRGSCANWTLSKVYDTASLSDSTYNAALMEAHRMAVRHGDGVHAEGSASHHWASRDVLLALNGIDTRHYPETEFVRWRAPARVPPRGARCVGRHDGGRARLLATCLPPSLSLDAIAIHRCPRLMPPLPPGRRLQPFYGATIQFCVQRPVRRAQLGRGGAVPG